MIFTPGLVASPTDALPLFEPAVCHLTKALRLGIGFADDLQPDPENRDQWFWSHSARWKARNHLVSIASPQGWGITPDVPNSAIHMRLLDIHTVRVLRALGETAPHPGQNRARRRDWFQPTIRPNDDSVPPLSLLVDWQVRNDEPIINLSLPKRPWQYGDPPELYWRVPVTGDTDEDLAKLTFEPGLLPGDVMVTIKVDPAESDTG
jgi:hypothetical protein